MILNLDEISQVPSGLVLLPAASTAALQRLAEQVVGAVLHHTASPPLVRAGECPVAVRWGARVEVLYRRDPELLPGTVLGIAWSFLLPEDGVAIEEVADAPGLARSWLATARSGSSPVYYFSRGKPVGHIRRPARVCGWPRALPKRG
jgi:hypothetical protein